ncbi:MAG TPA: DUF1801 domain-containing protein [Bacteroidia bacterium]|jgi:hypothetical protein|nr:DUF1801 domain-containing protein [Bacteroidia bacterium]
MLNPLEDHFLKHGEPHQSCMLFLRKWLIAQGLEEKFKYMTAMYYYKDKAFCYLTVSGKDKKLYLGFVKGHLMKHPKLEQEGRKQIKVLYLNPEKDLPIKTLNEIVKTGKKLY